MKIPLLHKLHSPLIIPAIAILLLAVFAWLLFIDIQNSAKELVITKNTTAGLELQNNEIERFKKVYSQYQPDLEKMNHLFVDLQNPVNVIEFLEKTAQDFQVASKISLQGTNEKKSNNKVMFLQLSASGDFSNLVHFLEAVENGPYLLAIESAAITNMPPSATTNKQAVTGKIDAKILIKVFAKP